MKTLDGYDRDVPSPIHVRFTRRQLEGIDIAVTDGEAASRADAIREAVDMYLARLRELDWHLLDDEYLDGLRRRFPPDEYS